MKERIENIIAFIIAATILISLIAILNNRRNGYVDQHTMWYDGQQYLYTFIYKDGDIHSFEKDSIHLVNDSIKEVRIKTAEETLKTLK